MNTPSAIAHYIGNDDIFSIRKNFRFFNHAGVSPLPKPVATALRKFADEAESFAYIGMDWWKDQDALRGVAAKFINADASEITLVKNTSEGISLVAQGLDWKAGDRIVTTAVEYPANVYPWMNVQKRSGVELVMVPEETDPATGARHVPADKIIAAIDEKPTKLVTLSHVEYASGQRHDLARIGAHCRAKGVLLNIDAIQSLGVVPVDVKAMNIDFLAADGHKWMLGPEGAGICYVRRELLDTLRPMMFGATSVINPMEFGNYDFTLKPDATRYESGSNPMPGLLALKAAIELLMDAGIDNISQRVKSLGDRVIAGVTAKGYRVVSPRTNDQWSGIVSFVAPDPAMHKDIANKLRSDHKIEIAIREGRLRASAHFYNTEDEIDALIEALPVG